MRKLRPLPHPSWIGIVFNTRPILVLLLVVAIGALLTDLPGYVSAQNQTQKPGNTGPQIRKREVVPGEFLVRFRRGSSLARLKTKATINISSGTGDTISVEINHFGGSELLDGLMLVRVAKEDTLELTTALRSREDVVYAEPNYIRHAEVVPNDPRYSDLWGLKDSAVTGGISAESAWNTTTGSQNVVVGVIDSGIDKDHLDLKDNIFVNTAEIPGNGVDDDSNGFVDDVNGWDFVGHDSSVFDNANDDAHGTHVAGTIGARGNNSIGVVGVNWSVQLMPLKAIGPSGTSDSSLLEAYSYAKMMRQRGVNLRVLNNSYGGQGFSQSLYDAIKLLGDAGILFVAAAGNETTNNDFVPHFPASFDLPNVISVAATSNGGFFASTFSNRGAQSVHLAAPGEDIVSTTPRGYSGDGLIAAYTEPDGSTYSRSNGTSMATPHVAGTAALACAANPSITLDKLRAAVLFGVDEGIGQVITGGRLNATRTVQFALENDTTAPAVATNFRINSQNGRRIELRWTEAGDDGITARASLDEVRFIDSISGEQFRLNSGRSSNPGTERTVFVSIPFKHPNGQLSLRTFDNVGNSSTATANVTVAADISDPYIVTLEAPGTLTPLNSGTPVGPRGDDVTFNSVSLPFPFPFFGFSTTSVTVSSNGALYVSIPPDFAVPNPNVGSDDAAVATNANLESLAMIAGMWADLRTDRNPTDNVYKVSPDRDRVIFRWQGVTFGSETPVNFEIELNRSGTIRTRYGSGNQNLNPVVVGISGGDPAAYPVPSHTSENAPLSLTNAQSVTFALRNPPPPPTADLAVSMTASPNPALSGQTLTYNVGVTNLGPSNAEDLVMTDVLPAGTTFVSCISNHVSGSTCTGPAVGSNGTVTGTANVLQPSSGISFTIVVNVTASPGTTLQNTASATNFRPDPNTANNSATASSTVVELSFFSGGRAIAAGRQHTTVVRSDSSVWSWGSGSNGQLGDGNRANGVKSTTPLQVPGLDGVVSVADGNGFVYALKADGTVWSWGENNQGQLGDGTTTPRPRPVQTTGLTNVTGITASNFFGAAVKADGTVWFWGASGGLNTSSFAVNQTPVQLSGISNVSAIAAGDGHLLMLKSDKTVWAAGANSKGQLGDGTTTPRPNPVQVNGLTNVARISGGDEFSVALKMDGTVWGWGINFNGQLGPDGGSMNFDPHPNPVQITGLPAGITEISAGPQFCLALAPNAKVWSWGSDGDGQLGHGTQIGQNPIPKEVPNLSSVMAIAAGNTHSVALKTDGSIWSWGSNSEGECGDASTTRRFFPVQVTGLNAVSSPSFSPSGGPYTLFADVVISCATPGATIHYTINGSVPTENDPIITSGETVHLTSFTFLQARAWKPGLVPSSTSFGQFDFSALPPQLLSDTTAPAADQILALDSMLFLRDPFPVVNPSNVLIQGSDRNTRVTLFVAGLDLAPNVPASSVVINLTDANNQTYEVGAEDVRFVPDLGITQVSFRLPNNLAPGTCQIKLKFHTLTSNVGTIRIKP